MLPHTMYRIEDLKKQSSIYNNTQYKRNNSTKWQTCQRTTTTTKIKMKTRQKARNYKKILAALRSLVTQRNILVNYTTYSTDMIKHALNTQRNVVCGHARDMVGHEHTKHCRIHEITEESFSPFNAARYSCSILSSPAADIPTIALLRPVSARVNCT